MNAVSSVSSVSEAKPRRGLSYRIVGGVFFGLLALGIAFAAFVYFTMIRYVPVAALHLPPDSSSAVRVDLEKIALYEPFRKHLLPLINELKTNPTAGPRLKRIQEQTKIDLALDIREIAAARGATNDQWVLVVGGKFPKQGVAKGMANVLRADGIRVELAADERTLGLPSGAALGQADDGAIIIASSRDRLAAALPVSTTHQKLGLSPETPVSFSVSGAPLSGLRTNPAVLLIPALGDLGRVQRATGELQLGSPLTGQSLVELEPGSDAKSASDRVQGLMSGLAALIRLTGSDFAGEGRVLESARVEPGAGSSVRVRFEWQQQDVDRAARSLAELARAQVHAGSAPTPR